MRQRARAAGAHACIVAALGLLLLAPPASAQVPDVPGAPIISNLIRVSVTVLPPAQEIPLLGQARYTVSVDDLSAEQEQGQKPVIHTVQLELDVNRTASPGWVAGLGASFFQTTAGQHVETFLVVQAPPTVRSQYFFGTVRALLRSPISGDTSDSADAAARVTPFSLVNVDIRFAPPSVGPFEEVSFPVTLTNVGLYPDTYEISATGPEGWFVAVQPRTTLFPGETRDVNVDVVTPANRVFVPQEVGVITVRVVSVNDPSVVYERAAIITLQGTFIPGYWGPVLVLGAVLAAGTGLHLREAAQRRSREQGKPLPPRLSPAQAVLLADLKRRDPERYRHIVAGQRRLFRARQRAFTALRRKRLRLETALIERQHAQERGQEFQRKVEERLQRDQERRVARERADLERRKLAGERSRFAAERRAEQAQAREEARQARLAAPNLRRLERERRAREQRLRAEMAKKRRLLAVEERKRRVALERRARVLARRKRELERRARKARPAKGRRRRGGEGSEPPGRDG